MTTRADLDHLTEAQRTAVQAAQDDLATFLARSASWPPEQVRDGLLELVPALVDQYGDLAATDAAQWYEDLRATQVPGSYSAVLAEPVPAAQVEASVRAAAGHLFTSAPDMAGTVLAGALQRYVAGQARSTIERNSLRDKAARRFARVPQGKTCAWCSMLASRGFGYTSAEAAGKVSKYHDKCDCLIVPAFGDEDPKITGYDPKRLSGMYEVARQAVIDDGGKADDKSVSAMMRDLFPDQVKDGRVKKVKGSSSDGTLSAQHYHEQRRRLSARLLDMSPADRRGKKIPPAVLPEAPGVDQWPAALPSLSAARLRHILYSDSTGGGHLPGFGWIKGGSEFPQGWDAEDALEALRDVIASLEGTSRGQYVVDRAYDRLVIRVVQRDGAVVTGFPLRKE